jgi:NADH-quinone oxidoreductase subunit I
MSGPGIFRSMGVTLQHLFGRKVTVRYPEQRPDLSPRARGRHIFHLDLCIGCTLCERVCPVDAIAMETHKNEETRQIEVDRFAVDLGVCYFCGLCEDVCPTEVKALHMGPDFEMASYDRRDLVWEMDRLDGPLPEEIFRAAGWVGHADAEVEALATMREKAAAKERKRQGAATPSGADAPDS